MNWHATFDHANPCTQSINGGGKGILFGTLWYDKVAIAISADCIEWPFIAGSYEMA